MHWIVLQSPCDYINSSRFQVRVTVMVHVFLEQELTRIYLSRLNTLGIYFVIFLQRNGKNLLVANIIL